MFDTLCTLICVLSCVTVVAEPVASMHSVSHLNESEALETRYSTSLHWILVPGHAACG